MFYAVANTIIRQIAGGVLPPPIPPFIWDLNTRLWEDEKRVWG